MWIKFDKKIQALWGLQVFFDLLNCQTSGKEKRQDKLQAYNLSCLFKYFVRL